MQVGILINIRNYVRYVIDHALSAVMSSQPKKGQGIAGDIEELGESLKRYSWTSLVELKGNHQFLNKLEETERLLKELKKSLSD